MSKLSLLFIFTLFFSSFSANAARSFEDKFADVDLTTLSIVGDLAGELKIIFDDTFGSANTDADIRDEMMSLKYEARRAVIDAQTGIYPDRISEEGAVIHLGIKLTKILADAKALLTRNHADKNSLEAFEFDLEGFEEDLRLTLEKGRVQFEKEYGEEIKELYKESKEIEEIHEGLLKRDSRRTKDYRKNK